jgi:hypothetical protein
MHEEILLEALTGGITANIACISAHVLTCLIPAAANKEKEADS